MFISIITGFAPKTDNGGGEGRGWRGGENGGNCFKICSVIPEIAAKVNQAASTEVCVITLDSFQNDKTFLHLQYVFTYRNFLFVSCTSNLYVRVEKIDKREFLKISVPASFGVRVYKILS